MNSNQRSEANNQSDNGGNDLNVSSSRAFSTADRGNLNQAGQSGTLHGDSQPQAGPGVHQSNDAAGGHPRSPGGNRQSADEKMEDDTGLSNNREPSELDQNLRQERQSNVGRRSDGTPD